ncbi:MAG: hypothetical protein FWE85_05885 [Clostridiales bacterium]|nr:hypothetical protein [Clostridiales bacterium]
MARSEIKQKQEARREKQECEGNGKLPFPFIKQRTGPGKTKTKQQGRGLCRRSAVGKIFPESNKKSGKAFVEPLFFILSLAQIRYFLYNIFHACLQQTARKKKEVLFCPSSGLSRIPAAI